MSVATRPMQQMHLGPIAGVVALAALVATLGLGIALGTIAQPTAPAVPGTSPSLFDDSFVDHRQGETGAGAATQGDTYRPGGFGGPRLEDKSRAEKDDLYVPNRDTGIRHRAE